MAPACALTLLLLSCIVSVAVATDYHYHGPFNRDTCYKKVLDMLDNQTLSLDDSVFYSNGYPLVAENLTLTLPGCEQMCGHQSWYWDIGPRLSTWLIPILLLVSNVDLSPLDKRRFAAIIHLLGDPIDSFWSLLHKIDSWSQCHALAGRYTSSSDTPIRRQIIATIFAAYEEIEGPSIKSATYFRSMARRSSLENPEMFVEWTRAAVEIADSRTDEFMRTWLAVLLYIWQVIASFVPEIGGGNTSPPGGRIGTAMFISWLVPAVLLSNTIGSFTSRRSCFMIISRFAERTGNPSPPSRPRKASVYRGRKVTGEDSDHHEALPWSGGIYTFRPWKTQYISGGGRPLKTFGMLLLASMPICTGMIGGFIIVWNTLPVGFNCRHLWMIGVFVAWFASVFVTWVLRASKYMTGKFHWRVVLVKDSIIALSTILIIFLSSSGLFNSCYCWSGVFVYNFVPRILLNAIPFYENMDRTFYPPVVAICLGLQICMFIFVAIWWRKGLAVMRWSEDDRHEQAEWVRSQDDAKARTQVGIVDLGMITGEIFQEGYEIQAVRSN